MICTLGTITKLLYIFSLLQYCSHTRTMAKHEVIKEDGTELNFWSGLGGYNDGLLRDEDVVKFINDYVVDPDRVTRINLQSCKHITDKALIAIADTCHNLTYLRVSHCSNVTGRGIDAIARKSCRKLKYLSAGNCNISHLPEDIGMLLPHLTHLDLQYNKIKKIPASLGRLADTIRTFSISGNPIQQPPRQIVNKGLRAIKRYYDELDIGTQQVSNEIKVVSSQKPVPSDDSKAPMREYGIIFISARFDGGPREQEARDLKDELVKIGLDARMVKAAAGRSFGDDTNNYLYSMKTMIAFCFDNYGQKTVSRYSTYWELNLANDKEKHIFPIRRCAEWPPKPPLDHDGGNKGIVQNYNVFTGGMAYLDWSTKKWDPAACAKKVKEELQK
jgi:hypothetical protein